MKKFLAIMLSLLVLLSLVSCGLETPNDGTTPNNSNDAPVILQKKKSYVVTFTTQIIKNNSVGNNWSSGVKFNNNTVSYGETIEADPPTVLSLVAYAVEEDKANSDHGNATVEFSDITIGEKETKSVTVTVTENEGRYKGNTAEWEFNITIERIK